MSRYPVGLLGDVVEEFRYGTSVKSTEFGDPVLRIPNVVSGIIDYKDLKFVALGSDEKERLELRAGDLLIVRTNGNPDYVGRCSVFEPVHPITVYASYLIRARLSPIADPNFVQWCLSSPFGREQLRAKAKTSAGQFNLNIAALSSIFVPLPPLDEQRRIVDILNHAASIQRLRDEARAKVREIVPALFIDMFGNPVVNPREWPTAELQMVSSIGSGVTKGRRLEGIQTVEVPYLRVANVQDGRLNLSEVKTIPIRLDEKDKYTLRPGDLVMTEGGDPNKLGRSAIWKGEIENCAHQNHVFRVRPQECKVLSDYLCVLIGSAYGKSYFRRVAKQTTGIASINRTQLGRFPVLVPPIHLQQEFADRVAEIESVAALADKAAQAAEQLTHSLLSQVFGPVPTQTSNAA